jgi:hypothetical protein
MNISTALADWKREPTSPYNHRRRKTQSTGTYSADDISNFLSDIKGGKAKAKAGRDNNIPTGSVHHLARTAVI